MQPSARLVVGPSLLAFKPRQEASIAGSFSTSARHGSPFFASLSLNGLASITPLWLLGRAPAASQSMPGTWRPEEASSSEDSDYGATSLDDSEVETLRSISCSLCNSAMISKQQASGRKGLFGRRRRRGSSGIDAASILVCDGCRRVFHASCCEKRGISTEPEGRTDTWYHDSGCKAARNALVLQAKRGQVPLPGGRSWQLLDCTDLGRPGLADDLGQLLEVLAPEYGPEVVKQLEGCEWAALLRRGTVPVTAALVDVFGQEVASMDILTTTIVERRRGHCRALMGALEAFLSSSVGTRSLVAVTDAKAKDTQHLLQDKLGFQCMNNRQWRLLRSTIPHLQSYEESTFLVKPLTAGNTQASSSSSSSSNNITAAVQDLAITPLQADISTGGGMNGTT